MQAREKISFLESFMTTYGPRNFESSKFPVVKRGKYEDYPFTVTETRNNYSVEFLGKKRFFGNAYEAGRWVERRGCEQARRDRPMQSCEVVQTPISEPEMPANASEFW